MRSPLRPLLLCGLLAGVLLAACGGGGAPDQVTVGQAQNGSTVELAARGTLTVSLPANPTTGYTWQASQQGTLVLRSSHYVAQPVKPGLVGSGGTATFEFQASGAGPQHLVMTYAQHFDPTARPGRTFTLTVKVAG